MSVPSTINESVASVSDAVLPTINVEPSTEGWGESGSTKGSSFTTGAVIFLMKSEHAGALWLANSCMDTMLMPEVMLFILGASSGYAGIDSCRPRCLLPFLRNSLMQVHKNQPTLPWKESDPFTSFASQSKVQSVFHVQLVNISLIEQLSCILQHLLLHFNVSSIILLRPTQWSDTLPLVVVLSEAGPHARPKFGIRKNPGS